MLVAHLLLALSTAHAADVDFAGARIVVPRQATSTEVFAARELSRYFRLVSGKESPIVVGPPGAKAVPTVVLGTAASLGEAAGLPEKLDDQAYLLRVEPTRPPRLVISGRTPVSVQYGVYSLLEKLGVGFYLGGDALPDRREKLLLPGDLNETRAPVFKIRGSLPWYNFLNSPTTWDLEDYQVFFDQMAKMKNNFVGFHAYDGEPFCAYPYDGQWRAAGPAATSLTYGWGALRPLKTEDFGFGTGRCFPYDVFGSRSVALATEPPKPTAPESPAASVFPRRTLFDEAVIRAQCVLAQGLEYATRRGVKVCVGFELGGDPTDPDLRRQVDARIRHLLATYPMIEYIWFWQSEGLGGGSRPPAPDSPLDLITQRYRSVFEYLGNEQRIAEAARVAAWVQYAHGAVKRLRPELGVIVSGWGGDAWMRFSDFYVGLDRLLPKDVIFAALDNIDPSSQDYVAEAYGKLSPGREKWPIPWFESDGGGTRRDQWLSETNAKPFTALVRDAKAKGCQGLLAIHWQTRGVEEVAAYSAQFAWDPDLSYESFYQTFARKCFGEKHAAEMAQILMRLEALGPRWSGAPGQVECGRFEWFSDARRPKPENLAALREIDQQLAAIGADYAAIGSRTHLERLGYLRASIAWVLNFDEASLALAPDGPVAKQLSDAEAAQRNGDQATARRLAEEALKTMAATPLRPAMEAYTVRLTSQGDFGNLAAMNVKAYAAFLDLWERAETVLGEKRPRPGPTDDPKAVRVIVKAPPTALPENTPFPVRAVVFGDTAPAAAVLHFRSPGGEWRERAMAAGPRSLLTAEIPREMIGPNGVEYYVEAAVVQPDGSRSVAYAPTGLTTPPGSSPAVVFTAGALPGAAPVVYGPYLHRDVSLATWGAARAGPPAFVCATVLPATEYQACALEAQLGATVEKAEGLYHLGLFPLPEGSGPQPALRASVRATDAFRRSGEAATVFAPPSGPPPVPAAVAAQVVGPFQARVTWSGSPGLDYEVHRSETPGFTPSAETLVGRGPWRVLDDIALQPNRSYEYAVVALDEGGRRSEPARSAVLAVGDFPLPTAPQGLTATPGLGRMTVRWTKLSEPVSGYAVFTAGEGGERRVSGRDPVKDLVYVVGGLTAAPRRFFVRAVDRAGRLGAPSAEVSAAALPVPQEPVFAASFDTTRAETGQEGRLNGKATVHDGVLDTREGGWIAYPGQELLQVSGPLTLELWVNVERIDAIPVLLSFGHWEAPGYWLQLFGNGVRFYLPVQKILDSRPVPPLGSWHQLVMTYDGRTSHSYLDGKESGSLEIGTVDLTPWGGELRIGQYADLAPEFQTRAQIDDVRIYQRALSPDEVKQSFEKGR